MPIMLVEALSDVADHEQKTFPRHDTAHERNRDAIALAGPDPDVRHAGRQRHG